MINKLPKCLIISSSTKSEQRSKVLFYLDQASM